ncbi:MAG: hypothetical protein ACRC9K_12135 [Afipia sp.]
MKEPSFIFGPRPGGENGVFIAPIGIDPRTAPASDLLLHITSATAQIAMQGVVAPPFPRIVPHTMGYAPIVFVNLISTKLVGGTFSYVRPYDNTFGPWVRSRVKPEATQFTIEQESLPAPGPIYPTPLDVNFTVFNRPKP